MSDALIRRVDAIEARAAGYVALEQVLAAAESTDEVDAAIAEHVLLVDHRTRLDGTPLTLVRLNRRHPRVANATTWGP